MKQLLPTVAVLISLLPCIFANTVPISPNGNEDYLDDCGTNNLTLQFPNLNVIDERFISFPMLRCLTIKNSGIEKVSDGAFDELPNLWYLNLQGNRIPSDDLFSFGNLSSVRKLILSDERPRYSYGPRNTIVRGIYPQLRYLDLKNSYISNIENAWENPFPELTYLDLSRNELESFTFLRSQAEKLTYLYLNDNKISRFTLGPSALMSLVLDNQNIRIIGEDGVDLGGLTYLKNLSLANNQIDSIRKSAFRDTLSLRHLDISMNLLTTIYPETLKDLPSLQVFILDQNLLEEVPIAVPLDITNLSMNCNRIKYLTINSLYNLPQLKTLSLTGNRITDVHTDAFQNQEMLEELYLNNNKLSHLPDEWCHTMTNLRYLDLSNNKFTMLESMIHCSVPSLRQIHAPLNPLKFIKASTLATLPEYVTVYLESDSNRTSIICRPEPSPCETDMCEDS